MNYVAINLLIGISLLIIFAGFIIYSIITNKIIRDQERELNKLRKLTRKVQHTQDKHREALYIVPDGRHPKFGGF